MLVDPNTGMPIEMDTPESLLGGAMSAQSATAGAISAVGQQAGMFGPGSIADAALDAVPGLSQTTAWNMFRGSRTIAYGGKGVNQISGFRATMSPRFMGRLPSYGSLGGRSVDNANFIFGKGKYKAGEVYTPFNVLARGGNFAFRNIAKPFEKNIASGGSVGKVGQTIARLNAEGEAFGIGGLSRISAMSKISRGKLPHSNVMDFVKATDSKLYEAINIAKTSAGKTAGTLTRAEAAHVTAMSMEGAVSGRVGGFMATLMEGKSSAELKAAGEKAGTTAYQAGAKAAEAFMEKGGFRVAEAGGGKFVAEAGSFFVEKMGIKEGANVGLRVAGKAMLQKGGLKVGARLATAVAINAAGPIGTVVSAAMLASLAMDVGKLGVEVFKSGVDFAKDAAISYKGSINKGVMGMGYRDNTVAATSRARGVQAIQNSRLNARSVLGSEAGAMHAHFG